MANWSLDVITATYTRALDSVALINDGKPSGMTDDEWKATAKRNWQHLEIIKAYKQVDDDTTSIWVDKRKDDSNNDIEWDWTAIDAAITAGKAIQA